MPLELRWLGSVGAGSMHAAAAMIEGATLVDARVSTALAEPVQGLQDDLDVLGVEPELAFEHLVPLAAKFDVPAQVAEVTLTKLFGPSRLPDVVPSLARRLAAIDAAFRSVFPSGMEELELRAPPLMGQWEARGPGLVATISRLTQPELIVDNADVVLVQPVLGGAGAAHVLYNSVRLEAVLANPIAELPEVVRLGWLLAQLNLDLPMFAGELARDRLAKVGLLAMLPPVLAAAEEVELARNDLPTLTLALDAWQDSSVAPDRLIAWWETYRSSRPSWAVALAALDRMLDPDPTTTGSAD